MSKPSIVDKHVHAHAILNMVAAVIQSPNGMQLALQRATEMNCRPELAIVTLGESFAIAAIRNIEQQDVFSVPRGSGMADALTLYIEGSGVEGREELEDRLQEGELASNACALLQNAPAFWTPDAPNPDDAPFPGSGANDGPERLNDLIRAAAYVLAEIGRLERKMIREDAYAAGAAERGTVVMPGEQAADTSIDQAVEQALDPTKH